MDIVVWLQHRYRMMKRTMSQGFSLVEMIVAVAIVALISSVVLTNYRGFDNSILLTNLAHDVAISIREAQVYGISVRGEGSDFSAGYGVHFDTNSPSIYLLFADTQAGGGYSSSQDTQIDLFSFDSRYGIRSVLEMVAGGGTNPIDGSFDVVFTRPDPEPVFYVNGAPRAMTGVRITVGSPDGSTRAVEVFSNGQISVQND